MNDTTTTDVPATTAPTGRRRSPKATPGQVMELARTLPLTRDVLRRACDDATPGQLGFLAGLSGDGERQQGRIQTRPPAQDGPASRNPRHSTDTTGGMASFPADWGREQLASLQFVDRAEDLVLYGDVGCGKTHLAIAIGRTGLQTHDTGQVLHGLIPGHAPAQSQTRQSPRHRAQDNRQGRTAGHRRTGLPARRHRRRAPPVPGHSRQLRNQKRGRPPRTWNPAGGATCSATATWPPRSSTASTRRGRIVRFHGESYRNTHSLITTPIGNRTAQTVQNGRRNCPEKVTTPYKSTGSARKVAHFGSWPSMAR